MFTPIVNADFGTTYTSNAITYEGSGPTQAVLSPPGTESTLDGATLVINGVETESPAILNPGDTLALRGVSAITALSARFAIVAFSNKLYVFAIRARQEAFDAVFPYTDPRENYIGEPSATLRAGAGVYTVDGTTLTKLTPENGGYTDTTHVVVSDYHGDALEFYDLVTNTKHVLATDKPFAIGNAPAAAPYEDIETKLVVGRAGTTPTVDVRRNQDLSVVDTYGFASVGIIGLRSNDIDTYSYVEVGISGNDGRIRRVDVVSGSRTVTDLYSGPDIPSGQLCLDEQNRVWITMSPSARVEGQLRMTSGNGQIRLINGADNTIQTIAIAGKPWGIVARDNHMFIADARGDGISIMNIETLTVLRRLQTHYNPMLLCFHGNDLYVSSINRASLSRHSYTDVNTIGSPVYVIPINDDMDTRRVVNGMISVEQSPFLLVSTGYTHGHIPATMVGRQMETPVIDPVVIKRPEQLTLAEFVVQNTTNPEHHMPVAVPNIYDAVLLRNGASAGQSFSAATGDELTLNMTIPAGAQKEIVFPLMTAGEFTMVSIKFGEPLPVAGYMGGG